MTEKKYLFLSKIILCANILFFGSVLYYAWCSSRDAMRNLIDGHPSRKLERIEVQIRGKPDALVLSDETSLAYLQSCLYTKEFPSKGFSYSKHFAYFVFGGGSRY